MPQADGHGTYLRRIALQLNNGGWYYFRVNPSNYSHSEPQRATILKTKSDIVIEDFGKDLEVITFSGTTGWKKDGSGRTGADRMRQLRDYVRNYASQGGNGNRSINELTFHNFTEGESYIVHLSPDGITMERDVEQPILYNYKISLVVIRDASTPADNESVDPSLGNQNSSIGSRVRVASQEPTLSPQRQGAPKEGYTFGDTTLTKQQVDTSVNGVVNPRGATNAYLYALEEIKTQIGYGGG